MTRITKSTKRVDKARERRYQSTRKPVKSQRSRDEMPEHRMPPVMVRGTDYAPLRPTKQKRRVKSVKRRYDISLATPGVAGVEIRLPSLPVLHLNWRILSFGLVVGLSILLYFMLNNPMFRVGWVEIEGIIRLTSEEINRTLNVIDQPIFSLNPDQIKGVLDQAYPELKDISIQLGLPAQVKILVQERVPLIAWVQDQAIYWIDGDGYAFSPQGTAENLVTVIAAGSPPSPPQIQLEFESVEALSDDRAFMTPELVNAILLMRSQAPEDVDLAYDPNHGLGWGDKQGWSVFFGIDHEQIDMKLLVYKSIVKKIKSEGITPALINLEHVHAPYYRMER